MSKSTTQRYYLVNGIQGLKLNSKNVRLSNTKSRTPSRSNSVVGDSLGSRPSSGSIISDTVKISNDGCDGNVIIHVYDENRNG